MLRSLDFAAAAASLAVVLGFVAVYIARALRLGRARFGRTDHAGGSALMGRSVLEAGYWSLQPIGRALAGAGVSANALSWGSLASAALAGGAVANGLFGFSTLFLAVSGFLDTLDGMVAGLTRTASDAGEVLDATVDRYSEAFFLGGLTLWYRDRPLLELLALAALTGSFMVSYVTEKSGAMRIEIPRGYMRRHERAFYLTIGAALTALFSPAVDHGLRLPNVTLPMAVALALVAWFANLSALMRLRALARAVRRRDTTPAIATPGTGSGS